MLQQRGEKGSFIDFLISWTAKNIDLFLETFETVHLEVNG